MPDNYAMVKIDFLQKIAPSLEVFTLQKCQSFMKTFSLKLEDNNIWKSYILIEIYSEN